MAKSIACGLKRTGKKIAGESNKGSKGGLKVLWENV